MLKDLDFEMGKSGLDAVIVSGESTSTSPELYYVTRASLPRGGIYVKKSGQDPLLVVSGIDVANAKKGVVRDVASYSEYGYEKDARRWRPEIAAAALYRRLLSHAGVTGRVGIYGRLDFNRSLALARRLQGYGYRVVAESPPALFERVMATKTDDEIRRIGQVGKLVQEIVIEVKEQLRRCKTRSGALVHEGRRLTAGAVKRLIRARMADDGLVPVEGLIFAPGRRSYNPHYEGSEGDKVRPGEPVVIDLFPRSVDNLYFDLTRTLLVGRAKGAVRRMHEAVAEAHDRAIEMAGEGVKACELMHGACDVFESQGFKTLRSLVDGASRRLDSGFVHSLGHGVGWTLGDRPSLTLQSRDVLRVGSVFTIEPGLYDRRVGGVRIEDVVAVTSKGVKRLSDIDYSLAV
ncbi:MAG: Xaa-Pro peptidase family protein [Candidatus Bathyarchaeia archaeon]